MNVVYCLDCDRKILINGKYDVGDAITCSHCDSEFEIVSLDPPTIEWLYDSYGEEDEEWNVEEQEEAETHKGWVTTRDQMRSLDPRLAFSTYWDE